MNLVGNVHRILLNQIKANYRQDYPPGSRTLGDFLF